MPVAIDKRNKLSLDLVSYYWIRIENAPPALSGFAYRLVRRRAASDPPRLNERSNKRDGLASLVVRFFSTAVFTPQPGQRASVPVVGGIVDRDERERWAARETQHSLGLQRLGSGAFPGRLALPNGKAKRGQTRDHAISRRLRNGSERYAAQHITITGRLKRHEGFARPRRAT